MFNERNLQQGNDDFESDTVYALYSYIYNGSPAQLRASKNIEKLKRNKENLEKRRDSIYKIKPIKELRKEQEMFNNLKEEMEAKGVSKEEMYSMFLVFAKHNFIFEGIANI